MAIKAEPTFSLADQLFNRKSVAQLASSVESVYFTFDKRKFARKTLSKFPNLELKERIDCLVEALDDQLPDDFNESIKILERALPEPLDPTRSDDDFGQFIWVVPSEWVARRGCDQECLAKSLAFLREATKRFSVESAIRPFLRQFPAETLTFVSECVQDDNYHVRRLASEGIRPYLPWALRVKVPVDDVLEVLTQLHADSTRYVTRSVANTLNDLSRDEPDKVIATLVRWQEENRQSSRELDWMTRHALRTLLKTDYRPALELMGYRPEPAFSLSRIVVPDTIKVGEKLNWQGKLTSKANQKLKICLRLHYLKANGTYSAKVFALKDVDLGKESLQLSKQLSFKPITTRTLYPGIHHIELVVNGKTRGKRSFELTT